MLPLVLLLLAQPVSDSRVTRVERVPGGRAEGGRSGVEAWAFFEAFPASGAGTFGPCSTTAPTGAKGEAMTFARTGNATCTKTATGGLATSGIANGDLVELSANQPRVEYDSAGVLGLLVEAARTNLQPRSQELDNATWGRTAGGSSSAPTIPSTNNTAPDNTATAERLSFSACPTVGDYSQLAQIVATSAVAHSNSVYMRAVSGTATISVCGFGSTGVCTQCTADDKAWTRCVLNNWTGAASAYFVAGCINNTAAYTGATNTGAADVYLWGVQMEVGAYATSYVPTTSMAVARNAETATMPVAVSQLPISIAWSSAQTLPQGGASNDRIGVMTRELSGSGNSVVSYFQAQFRSDAVGSASGSALNGGTSAAGDRWATSHDTGGVLTSFKNGTQTATNTTAKTMNAATVVGIGASPAGLSHLDGIVSRVCVDPSPTRCR